MSHSQHLPQPLYGLLSVPEAAQRLGLRPSTLRAWILARRVEYVRLGRAVRLRPETVQHLIDAGTIPAKARP